jgi:hypothetical protein
MVSSKPVQALQGTHRSTTKIGFPVLRARAKPVSTSLYIHLSDDEKRDWSPRTAWSRLCFSSAVKAADSIKMQTIAKTPNRPCIVDPFFIPRK